MIDEGSQLRHYLPVTGIVEKHTWRHRLELLQHADKFSRSYGAGSKRRRHLRETHAFYDDERQLIQSTQQATDELMALFKADVKKWDEVIVNAGIEKK